MSRTLKLRAWTGKTMLYQDQQYLGSFLRRVVLHILLDHDSGAPREHESYLPEGKCIDDYLMLCIGQTDRGGRDIYQGDLLTTAESEQKFQVLAGFSHPDVSLFATKDVGGDRITLFSAADHLEVIGNIHEEKS